MRNVTLRTNEQQGNEVDLRAASAAFLTLAPFCEPTYFANCLPVIHDLYMVLEFLVLVYVAYKLIRDRKMTRAVIVLFLFQLYLVTVTVILGGRATYALNSLLVATGAFLVVETFYEKDEKSFLAGGIALYLIIAIASLLSIFLFPDGLYRANNGIYGAYYLYGHKNDVLFNLFPGLVFAMVYAIKEKTPGSCWLATLFTAVVFANVLVLNSVTSSLACFILYALFLVARKGKLKRLSGVALVVLVVFVFTLILTGGVQFLFGGIFDALNRDLTFSSRTFIWERAISAISSNPIFGYGVEETAITKMRFGGFTTPHNFALAELFYGGIVGVLLCVSAVWSCVRRVKNAPTCNELNFLMAALLVLFVMSTMESMGIGLVKFAVVLAMISCTVGRRSRMTPRGIVNGGTR